MGLIWNGCFGNSIFVPQNNQKPTMSEKLKRIDKPYVLSDSSVNEYGFRLLTSGCQLEEFRKNPIGYYMHRRDEGIALRWDDLKIEGDQLVGTPVINLAHSRGEQLVGEAENGFLNAASVGHIVVLEHSTDPALMLPGQVGPTITKWYCKECSLVDIPGNSNALAQLYDVQEHVLNLAGTGASVVRGMVAALPAALRDALQLPETATEQQAAAAVQSLAGKVLVLDEENKTIRAERTALQLQLDQHRELRDKAEAAALLERALEDKKITVALRERLAADYAGNTAALRALLEVLPAYRSIAEQLKNSRQAADEGCLTWDDYEKSDPTGKKLKDLRANDPAKYKALFELKFGASEQ